jgi:NAD(P)-dependent dehydrogenase (short-subunit alcohol dehydrogenase family)
MSVPVALVTGANRGLGREVVRQLAAAGHTVFLGSRDLAAGEAAAREIPRDGGEVHPVALDVTDPERLSAVADLVEREAGRLDVIVNNAAVNDHATGLATAADLARVREALETNLYGAWNVVIALLPLLRRSDHGRIVNVSSGYGALSDMGGGLPAYRLSKVGLNALTRMWAAELSRERILVNAVCPGWVATDMGGPGGRPVRDGAAGIVWAATLPDDGPTGGFFRDGEPIAW